MKLKTLRTLPPGGWIFEQKKPDGTVKKFEFMTPFGEAVKVISDYRKGNGIEPSDEASIAVELENQTCQRLGNDPNWCMSEKKTSLLDRINVLPAHVKALAQRAGEVGRGVAILSDWLGDGAVPVDIAIAQKRADTCLLSGPLDEQGRPTPCPHNRESHGVMQMTDSIANAILEQRRKKSDMNLTVKGEPGLHTCDLCSCHLPLKVFVPMKTIKNRTHPSLIERFPDFCWMKTENRPKEEEPQEIPLENHDPTPVPVAAETKEQPHSKKKPKSTRKPKPQPKTANDTPDSRPAVLQ